MKERKAYDQVYFASWSILLDLLCFFYSNIFEFSFNGVNKWWKWGWWWKW